jgi:hypothetical protein
VKELEFPSIEGIYIFGRLSLSFSLSIADNSSTFNLTSIYAEFSVKNINKEHIKELTLSNAKSDIRTGEEKQLSDFVADEECGNKLVSFNEKLQLESFKLSV